MILRIGTAAAVKGLAAILFLSLAGAAQAQTAPPAGMARVWFVRELSPGTAMHAPWLFANGQPVWIAAQGNAFYRDFPPGSYDFNVENCIPQPGTAIGVRLEPGMVVGLEVTAAIDSAPLGCTPRDVYYVQPVSPQALPGTLARLVDLGPR